MSQKISKVLVVEDDPDDQILIKEAFQETRKGYRLCFVKDGLELLDYLGGKGNYKKRSSGQRPDLILLDLNLPRMNGIKALQAIKDNAELRGIPVVILTASRTEEDVWEAYDQNVGGFVTKPATYQELVNIILGISRYWFSLVELPG